MWTSVIFRSGQADHLVIYVEFPLQIFLQNSAAVLGVVLITENTKTISIFIHKQ